MRMKEILSGAQSSTGSSGSEAEWEGDKSAPISSLEDLPLEIGEKNCLNRLGLETVLERDDLPIGESAVTTDLGFPDGLISERMGMNTSSLLCFFALLVSVLLDLDILPGVCFLVSEESIFSNCCMSGVGSAAVFSRGLIFLSFFPFCMKEASVRVSSLKLIRCEVSRAVVTLGREISLINSTVMTSLFCLVER